MSERGLAGLRHAIIVACAGLMFWIAGALPASATRHVVLLFDERADLPGLAAISAEFVRTISEKSTERIEIYREEMDRSRFNGDYRSLFRDFLRAKYAGKKIDAVVAVFGAALDFLLDNGAEIFPGASIIFCGIDRAELGHRALPPQVRGVLMRREFSPTLELALSLHPQTRQAIVVAGTSDFDKLLLEQARSEFEPHARRVNITYVTSLPLQKLLSDLKQLPPGSIILITSFFKDGAGESFVPHDVVPLVSAAANAPLFGFLDQFLGRGIVGGKLYGASSQGAGAAELVLHALSGAVVEGPQLREPPASKVQFDWRQLQRWGISELELPPGSDIRFRSPSIWARYQLQILGIVAALLVQSGLIAWLIYEHRRRSAAEVQSRNAMAELASTNRLATAGQLSASIAHEINQPVTGVVLKAGAALRWLAAEKPDLDKIRSLLNEIVGAGQRAGDIVNSVRAMFKEGENAKGPINLNNLINTVLVLLRVDLQRDDVRVETRLDEQLPAVTGDPVQLQQVILNLVTNAADAMRTAQRRVLTVQTSRIAGKAHVSIEDTGPGVSDSDRGRIFNPLFTTKTGGMGMGLSICRSIIENHRGRIWVEAVIGPGAVFQFELPAVESRTRSRDPAT